MSTDRGKRRKGFPSETRVMRGQRFVHGNKELLEKLGRNDPCPCGSARLFQELLPRLGVLSMVPTAMNTRADLPGATTLRVLFICSRNRLRSPTAEQVFAAWPGVETASAGLARDADNPVTPELLVWADRIFVMEPVHRRKLSQQFRAALKGKRVVCLGIPDHYACMDPALVERLLAQVPAYLR